MALFCASIVLATITGSIYFVTKIAGEVVSDAGINYKVINLKDYIIENKIISNENFKIENGDVYYLDNLLFPDTSISSIDFEENNTFYYSQINYHKSKGDMSLRFVVMSKVSL